MTRHSHLLLALAIVVAMPLCMQSGSLASEVLIFGLAAMGCNLLLGYTGLLSFGQGIFFGLGSYTIALLLTRWPLPMPLALLAATAMGAVGAAIVGWVAIRQRGTYFVMLTLAFAQMFYFLAYSATDITGGDNGLLDVPRPALAVAGQTLWPLATPWQYYGFVAVLFLVVFWLLRRVCDSMFGRTLLAVRDNEERAAAVGYDLRLLKLQAFVIDLSGQAEGLLGMPPGQPLDMAARWRTALVSLLPVGCGLYALRQLWTLFGEYLQGRVFGQQAQHALMRFAWTVLAGALALPFTRALMSVAASMGNPPGQRFVTLGLYWHDGLLVLLGVVLVSIAHVMLQARRIADENAGFV